MTEQKTPTVIYREKRNGKMAAIIHDYDLIGLEQLKFITANTLKAIRQSGKQPEEFVYLSTNKKKTKYKVELTVNGYTLRDVTI